MPSADDAPTPSLNGRPPAASTAPLATPPPASTAPLPGGDDAFERWLGVSDGGRYRRLSVHRDGGLGRVWRAEDTTVRREVALKTLRPDRQGDPALADRFVREAQVTGRLEHPNIVPLYDLLVTADGPAYAMRFVDGETLADAAAAYHAARADGTAGPLALERLLDAFVLVCRAVGFAHDKGVLHRDLKGQNVLLGRHGEVCLADWGLAKRTADPDRPDDPHPLSAPLGPATADGHVMGTPAFMAPEVARGEPATVGSDVYGLGAVLYQLLTNKVPHAGTTPKEVLEKVKEGRPVRPVREVNPAVPAALEAVCRKALGRDPGDRYESAEGLADDVRRWLAGEPVGAYPEPWAAKAGRWARRHRAGVLAGVVALAVAAVGASVAAVLVWQEKERTAAEKRQADVLAAALLDFSSTLARVVGDTETGRTAGPQSVTARKEWADRAATVTARLLVALPNDPGQRTQLAKLLWYAANLARLSDDRAAAEQGYAAAAVVQQGLVDQFPAELGRRRLLAHIWTDEAALQTRFGRLVEALMTADRAAAAVADLPGSPDDRRADGMIQLCRAEPLHRLGRPAESEAAADSAAARFARLAADPGGRHTHDPAQQGLALLAQARARRAGGRPDARAAEDRAVEVLQAAATPDAHADLWTGLHSAVVDRARQRLDAGEPTGDADLDRAVAGLEEWAARDPNIADRRYDLAVARSTRGRVRAAAGHDPSGDFTEAIRLLDQLAAAAPGQPTYPAELAVVLAAVARRLPPGVERQATYQRAVDAAQRAARHGPGDVVLARTQEAVTAEAGAGGRP